jgi:DNA-binding CsgD family transcriptional regulator/PAS domain-containing protein
MSDASRQRGVIPANQSEFETLISETSASILSAPAERIEEAIGRALASVRGFFQADRCVLLTVSADLRRVSARLGSYAEGVPPVPADIDLAGLFPWARQHLLVERSPARAGTFADLPPDAAADRAGWECLGMVSCLTLPIDVGGGIRHMIMLQTVNEERPWADSLVVRLRVLGELMAGALDRQELLSGLGQAEARLRSGSDLAGLGFFEIDFAAGTAHGDSRLRELCGFPLEGPLDLGAVDRWVERLHPDDRPRVLALRQQVVDGRLDHSAIEYRYRHPVRGEIRIHHLASVSRRDASGRALAISGAIRDVSVPGRAETASPGEGPGPVEALTPRQREVLRLLAEGRTELAVAAALGISARTVEFHKYRVMEALGLTTRAQLIHFAIKHGLIEL